MSDDINAVLTFDPFAGSLATREHAWRGERLLGSFACEKISPRWNNSYISVKYGELVSDFLVRFKQLSFWNFKNFLFRLSRVTSSGSAKQVFSTFHSPHQKIPMDSSGFFGLYWIHLFSMGLQLSLSMAYPLIVSLTDFPSTQLFNVSAAHFTFSVTYSAYKKLTNKCGKFCVF